MKVEDQYTDVLQNIEFGIVQVFKHEPQLADFNVMEALDAATAFYKAEQNHHTPKPPPANERDAKVYRAIMDMCQWRLGRIEILSKPSAKGKNTEIPRPAPITVDEVILCLRRLRKSAEFWTKQTGRQGYLNYISQFIE